jgi:hypothetical protein
MIRFGYCLHLSVLTLGIVGCGTSRELQSVALSPASAVGHATFTATGTFNRKPSPVQLTNKDLTWCAGSSTGMCIGNINPGITIDQNGSAQCAPSFTGTVTVLAGTPSSAMTNPDGGSQLKVFGTAQLTCP